MRRYQGILSWSVLLASIGGAQAKLDLNSTSNIVVYWGQNSFNGKGDKAQQPLAHYCDNEDIDVIPMAFNMMVNGPGGAPEVDFSVTSKDCEVFEGTQLKNCPKIGKDIQTCQKKHKTILLSIGGATYSEGGFKSEADAKDGAKLMWETFGPKKEGSKALRPFGDAVLDGFDFDFEANVQHMAPFANELRALMDADKSKQKFYLTAAPQCPYPDQADKDILNGPVYIDAVWVQFYNNFCGVNAFSSDSSSNKYNFDEWDNWAHTVSKNKDVKVIVGVPAFTTAASTGYIPASELAKVIEYSKKFKSFGGVMMWDATQAYGNDGFIKDVRKSLGPADDDSGSSSPDPASTSAPASTSTDSTKTTTSTDTKTTSTVSSSSNAPASSLSSSSSSSASASQTDEPTSAENNPTDNKPKPTTTATPKPATTEAKPEPTTTATPKPATTEAKPKPTTTAPPKPATTEAKPKPTTTATPKPATTEVKPTKIATTVKPEASATKSSKTTASPTKTAAPSKGDNENDSEDSDDEENNTLSSVLGNDLMSLLGGLRQANNLAGGVANGLAKGLRHGKRNRI
ncbi:uncharacterized protein N7515_001010 [Penicillium bovifimosum]|uniref:chitinase n=1 Tax=Penicillium bovifimosum TaxID=126998 RepID=A0A9W9HGT2_9EURO|nr:uncharacterized protein N7515_001010 [Penicillium bovifimosum]KAJ5146446.1 hypothetical protein N7515_001010 [Penicillium bovifimosum]